MTKGGCDLFFYLGGLLISLTLSVGLFLLLLRCLQTNWKRKNRHPVGFLLPVVVTAAFIYVSVTLMLPCLFDLVPVLTRAYALDEWTLEADQIGKSTLLVNDQRYHYWPGTFDFQPQRHYRITATPRSRFIMDSQDVTKDPYE